MGLSPVNCRKVMTSCMQSVAMSRWELWWRGGHAPAIMGRAEELQLLVNQQARATTGCFRTTNLGARDGVWPQPSSNTAGKLAAALWATAVEPAAGRPGEGNSGGANRDRAVTHECPDLCGTDGNHSSAGGIGDLRRRTAARGGNRR